MKGLKFLSVLFGIVVLASGCATTTGPKTSGSNCNQVILCKDYMTKVDNLSRELQEQREANASLKKEIDEMSKLQVRMPNGKEIQTALKNAGFYKGPIDGQIGSQTKESIKKFQEANKLPADGVIGSKTWNLLYKFLGMPGSEEENLK